MPIHIFKNALESSHFIYYAQHTYKKAVVLRWKKYSLILHLQIGCFLQLFFVYTGEFRIIKNSPYDSLINDMLSSSWTYSR